ETHQLELLNRRMSIFLLAIDLLFIPSAEVGVKTGIVFGCQFQFDLHGSLAVIYKERVWSYPAIEQRIAFQFIEKSSSSCQFAFASLLVAQLDDAISQRPAQTASVHFWNDL